MIFGQGLAGPMKVHPGGAQDIVVDELNGLNGTFIGSSDGNGTASKPTSGAQLPLAIVNNLAGASDNQINVYVTGRDSSNNVVMLASDGSFYYPPPGTSNEPSPISANVAIPLGAQGSTTNLTLPDYISSGRIYLAVGNLQFFVMNDPNSGTVLVEPSAVNAVDPNSGVNWGFVELTYTADGGLYANISYVDFVGLILGMSLVTTNGSVQAALGLQPDAVSTICTKLVSQSSADAYPWGNLCMGDNSSNYLRVMSPYQYIQNGNSDAFSDYFTSYIDTVYSTYSGSNTGSSGGNGSIIIDTQSSPGNVSCSSSGDSLTCDGDNRDYPKPSAGDIFGCNTGPFAIQTSDNPTHDAVVPRLCAAFNRGTFLIPGGNFQPGPPATSYYTTSPSNYYSKFVHENEVDGKGYAFAYDDVNPAGENESGVVSASNPQTLTITVGGAST
ncbi:putative glucan endo-1,3-beta-glucosidase precursor [Talaromyces proteolyticus]|uniref:Glucan endo-1,3-beta-glucosidase n=1 Tax=Talaromyces proteolyticus TaxID=1131652 RepID=A0AAD4KT25_9EURO|nr:putative glucan endo-1,3-beta-glucosidase precursor [Talaromyces proteolyticus]KAH8698687.1 putative glucan endo-1,3-beta-glucosidase precursor [Talaromyces proteolyticus]